MTVRSIRQPPELMALLDGARLLNPVYRPGFLDAAAEQLMRKPSLDEHEVRQTVREVLRRIDLWQARVREPRRGMTRRRHEPRQQPAVSILDCVDSPHLFAPHFKDPATWAAWRCFLKGRVRPLRRESKRSPFVFVSERGAPLVHPHMLRHACGFALANAGHDTRSLQAYLGHRNIQHTVRYTELSPDRFKYFWKD